MHVLALHTGLFPDAASLDAALGALAGAHEIRRLDLTRPDMEPQDWDQVVTDLLAADLVITV